MEETLRIATYNIRMDTIDDGVDQWSNRSKNVLRLIRDYDFDIIGLQEVKETQKKDLIELEDYGMVGRGRSDDKDNEYNTLMFKKEKLELIEEKTFWLSSSPEIMSLAVDWGASCPRICTEALFKVRKSGLLLKILNVHFDHISEEARYKSAQLILSRLDHQNNFPVMLIGDFNGGKDERYHEELKKKLLSALDLSQHHVGPYVTCTSVGFKHDMKWENMVHIDHIFLNKTANKKFRVLKSAILTDRYAGRFPSDHFPVMVDINL